MSNVAITLAIIGLAGLIHASFQLSTSLLTLLSGHSLSVKRSQFRIFRLTSSFLFGASVMLILLLSFFVMLLSRLTELDQHLVWSILAGLSIGVGLAVLLTYYRKGRGTSLWVPRDMADYLSDRTVATKRSAEAFTLGMGGVIGEILFIVSPLAVASYAMLFLPSNWQLVAILGYATIAMTPLIIVWSLVGYRVRISRIQAWRERNKYFLQHASVVGLFVLAAFIYTYQIVGTAS